MLFKKKKQYISIWYSVEKINILEKKSTALLPLYHHIPWAPSFSSPNLLLSLSLSRMAKNQASLLLQKQLKGLSFIFDSSTVSLSLYRSGFWFGSCVNWAEFRLGFGWFWIWVCFQICARSRLMVSLLASLMRITFSNGAFPLWVLLIPCSEFFFIYSLCLIGFIVTWIFCFALTS